MKKINHLLKATLLVVALVLVSCQDEKGDQAIDTCNTTNPLEELSWLKDQIKALSQSDDELSKYAYYMTATYKKETVFYYGNCHPAINAVFFVLNCEGEPIGNLNDLRGELTNQKLLWAPERCECNFND